MDFEFTMAKKLFSISLVLCIHAHSVWFLLNHISPFNLPCTYGKSVDIGQSWKNVPLQEGEKNVGRRKGEEAGYKQGDTHHYRGRRDFTCMPRNANFGPAVSAVVSCQITPSFPKILRQINEHYPTSADVTSPKLSLCVLFDKQYEKVEKSNLIISGSGQQLSNWFFKHQQ